MAPGPFTFQGGDTDRTTSRDKPDEEPRLSQRRKGKAFRKGNRTHAWVLMGPCGP